MLETNNFEIDMRQVPDGYVRCFNKECDKREDCLRWIVGEKTEPTVTVAPTVLPTVLGMQACPHFRKAQVQQMAWGFTKLFAEVKSKDEAALRDTMKAYLGGNGTYSRYKLGRRLLSPAQQEHILSLFRAKGYTEGLAFDHYVSTYDFDH